MLLKKEDYKELELLYSGMYGPCYKIQRLIDGEYFTWKVIAFDANDEEQLKRIENEIDVVERLDHENIVKYYGHAIAFDEGNRGSHNVYIIMEYCEGGSLLNLTQKVADYMCSYSEGYIWMVLYQLIQALGECHKKKNDGNIILLRNLKPSKVFLTRDMKVKLGDFSCSRILDVKTRAATVTGTPLYMAPELYRHEEYNEKCDIWSLGCLIYEMCALRPPFVGNDKSELAQNIMGRKAPDIPSKYSNDLRRIIKTMLEKEPLTRPSAKMLASEIIRLVHSEASFCDDKGRIKVSSIIETKGLLGETNSFRKNPANPVVRFAEELRKKLGVTFVEVGNTNDQSQKKEQA